MAKWLPAIFVCVSAAAQSPVFHLGPGIEAPFVAAKTRPAYSDEARLAKLEGSVLLSLVVGGDGHVRDIRVARPLGLGLDESAVDNVGTWHFNPGKKDGIPADVAVQEEVFFRPQRTLWDWHVVRAVFQTAPQEARPVLIGARFPPTINEEENGSVTVAFEIGMNGVPAGMSVIKSSNARWEAEILKAVREGWRFLPGRLNDKPVIVPAWFEFVRGSHAPIPPAQIPTH